MTMTYQIIYEPEKGDLSHSVYELSDFKDGPKEWRRSFKTEAEAHRWVKDKGASN